MGIAAVKILVSFLHLVMFPLIVNTDSCNKYLVSTYLLLPHAVLDRPPETIGEPTIGGNTFSEQLGRNLEVNKCLQETQVPAGVCCM